MMGSPPGRPRVLFLAYFFPPVREIASVRTLAMAKHLARHGWHVTVVTSRGEFWRRTDEIDEADRMLAREGVRCLRTRYPLRFLTPQYTIASFEHAGWLIRGVGGRLAAWARRLARAMRIPREIGWIRQAERAATRPGQDRVDLILASGSPFSTFGAARRLARRLRCTYVLDYRDLWSGNPYLDGGSRGGTLLPERRLLDECAATIAVTPGLAQALQQRFQVGSKLQVLSNGFDPEELARVTPRGFDHFAIVYAGCFYPPKSVITPLIGAIAILATREEAAALRGWAFHYFGRHAEHVRAEARRFDVERHVVIHGEVSRSEALRAVKGAGMAVVITSVAAEGSLEERGVVTGKVFEAIGLGTPVLAIAPPESDLEEIFRTAGLGRRFSGHEVPEIAAYLEDAMRGRVPPARDREAFSWSRLGARLDRILRGALDPAPGAISKQT